MIWNKIWIVFSFYLSNFDLFSIAQENYSCLSFIKYIPNEVYVRIPRLNDTMIRNEIWMLFTARYLILIYSALQKRVSFFLVEKLVRVLVVRSGWQCALENKVS